MQVKAAVPVAIMSRPSRARGLKLAAIEPHLASNVAPFTGAWIETFPGEDNQRRRSRRALYGRVD